MSKEKFNCFLFILTLLLFSITVSGQQINGNVFEKLNDESITPLPGANIVWQGTNIGTVSDSDGNFSLKYDKSFNKLEISFIGFKSKIINVEDPNIKLEVVMESISLETVTLKSQKKTLTQSYLDSRNITLIDSEELLKAACCNLSESFETNPTIDVNYSDAVSGAKEIKMLGLSSPYILINSENIPMIRGAAQAHGLSFIPGSWIESMQITKGAGSVINGFESITGQINVEFVKPQTDPNFFLNLFGSVAGRFEINTHVNTIVSPKWDTGIYIHGSKRNLAFDRNKDSFLDMPLGDQINVMNRWQYTNPEKGLISLINFRILDDNKLSGQLDYIPSLHKFTNMFWGSEVKTKRFDFSGKFGYVNPEITYQSLGLQLAFSNHKDNSYFGNNIYNIKHKSIYSNLIYNSIISDTRHKIKTGFTFFHDNYKEIVNDKLYERNENSLGGFFEYSFDNLDNVNLTAGVRLDHHNLLGTFLTPRFNLRYTPWSKSALRFSFGRGKRAANIFTENQKIFASSRTININNNDGKIYGLSPEIAWNYGLSYSQKFDIFNRNANITVDYYATKFKDQVVVDYEIPTEINFYNLIGNSHANSLQLDFNYTPIERFDLRTAYKHYDVQTDFASGTFDRPLIPKNRFFSNFSYQTELVRDQRFWKFDLTYNWVGRQRLPSTATNQVNFQLSDYSPSFTTLNFQITKVFSKKFELYTGGENVTNFRQKDPILAADDPFGSNFDSTFVYGPIFGSMYYAGLRLKLY